MQTPVIFNTGNVNQGAKPAAKQNDNNESGASFGQVLSQQIADKRPADNGNKTRESNKANEAGKSNEGNKPSEANKAGDTNKTEASGKSSDAAKAAEGTGDTSSAKKIDETDSAVTDSKVVDPTIAQMLALATNNLPAQQVKLTETAKSDATSQDIATIGALAQTDTTAEALKAGTDAVETLPQDQIKGLANDKTTAAAVKPDASFKAALADAKGQTKATAEDLKTQPQDKGAGLQTALAATENASGTAQEKLTTLAAAKFQENATPTVTAVQMQQAAGIDPARATTGRPTEHLTPQVGTPGWDQALGQKVVWMVAGAQQSASLTLNPPDLGPLQVVLNVSNGQADASFYAAQPEVRQALEAALPKLRDMMSDAGVQLGQTTVSAGMPDQHNQPGERQAQNGSGKSGNDAGVDIAAPTVRQTIIGGQGLVDTFA